MNTYIAWLRATFQDHNEQQRLRDKWHATVQRNGVQAYASELLYLRSQIIPTKSDNEVKEHFRTGLTQDIQIYIAEHPEWEQLGLNDYIAAADRAEQIEEAKARARGHQSYSSNYSRPPSNDRGRAYAIAGAPRRGGRRPSSVTRRPRKGTAEWKQWCREKNACYSCGDTDHLGRDCPDTDNSKELRGRTASPYPPGRNPSRSRERSSSRTSSTSRNPSQKNVSFREGKDRV